MCAFSFDHLAYSVAQLSVSCWYPVLSIRANDSEGVEQNDSKSIYGNLSESLIPTTGARLENGPRKQDEKRPPPQEHRDVDKNRQRQKWSPKHHERPCTRDRSSQRDGARLAPRGLRLVRLLCVQDHLPWAAGSSRMRRRGNGRAARSLVTRARRDVHRRIQARSSRG
jgi:hypothetical protein